MRQQLRGVNHEELGRGVCAGFQSHFGPRGARRGGHVVAVLLARLKRHFWQIDS